MSGDDTMAIINGAKPINVDKVMCDVDRGLTQVRYVMPEVEHLLTKIDFGCEFIDGIKKFLFHAANYLEHKDDPIFIALTKNWDSIDISVHVAVCMKGKYDSHPNVVLEARRIIALGETLKMGVTNQNIDVDDGKSVGTSVSDDGEDVEDNENAEDGDDEGEPMPIETMPTETMPTEPSPMTETSEGLMAEGPTVAVQDDHRYRILRLSAARLLQVDIPRLEMPTFGGIVEPTLGKSDLCCCRSGSHN